MSHQRFSLCIYCGSRNGTNPTYRRAATALGRAIADQNWRLVFGAGDVGLMGAVAQAAQAGGAETLGVIPTHLVSREIKAADLTTCIITETMHERKKVMFMNADAVAVLPGGAGSLDEFFEVLTWRQLGLHEKPLFLLDVAQYWSPLVSLMEHVVEQGFAEANILSYVRVVPTVEALVAALRLDQSA